MLFGWALFGSTVVTISQVIQNCQLSMQASLHPHLFQPSYHKLEPVSTHLFYPNL